MTKFNIDDVVSILGYFNHKEVAKHLKEAVDSGYIEKEQAIAIVKEWTSRWDGILYEEYALCDCDDADEGHFHCYECGKVLTGDEWEYCDNC